MEIVVLPVRLFISRSHNLKRNQSKISDPICRKNEKCIIFVAEVAKTAQWFTRYRG
jgi:hypothetical protein